MRVFGTFFFGLIFLILFIAFFSVHSVVGMPTDSEAMVGALKDANFHGAMMQVVEETVQEKAREDALDAKFTGHVLSEVAPVIESVISEEWFYETLESAHKGLIEYLESGKDTTKIDLKKLKKDLIDGLNGLGEKAVKLCKEQGGGAACDDVEQVSGAYENYKGQIKEAVDKIPDETNFTALLNKSGADVSEIEESEDMKKLREGMGTLKTVRLGGVVVLLIVLGLIALINMRSMPRILVNVGIVLAISCAVYLGGVNTLGPMAKEELSKEIKKETKGGDRVEQIAEEVATKVVLSGIERTYKRSNTTVTLVLVLGLAMFVGGIVLNSARKRREDEEPDFV